MSGYKRLNMESIGLFLLTISAFGAALVVVLPFGYLIERILIKLGVINEIN